VRDRGEGKEISRNDRLLILTGSIIFFCVKAQQGVWTCDQR
jgi:hypothetical protein